MRIVALSDTHGLHNRVTVPDGDVLIHCGDVTQRGEHSTLESFGRWLGDLPHRHILLTWGNHDLSAEENPAEAAAIVQRFAEREIRVLVNQTVRLAGAVIYGAPYSNPFGDWAFMPTEAAQDNLFANIPDDADVVFTHGPPFGYGDCVVSGQDVGSVALLNRLWYVRPRYAFCGHIHEAHGRYKVDWGPDSLRETVVFNVSVLDEKYRVRNLPVVVDL